MFNRRYKISILLFVMYLLTTTTNLLAEFNEYAIKSLNPVGFEPVAPGKPVELVKNGKALATIVIPVAENDYPYAFIHRVPGSTSRLPTCRMAAQELAHHLAMATGAEFPIISEKDSLPDGNLILVGKSSVTDKFGIKTDDLPPEGFRVQTFERGVAIVGAAPLSNDSISDGSYSTLYGVYDFLERFLGIRWYYPGDDGCIIPTSTSLIIRAIAYSDYPRMNFRVMYPWSFYNALSPPEDPDEIPRHALRYRAGGHGPFRFGGCHSPDSFEWHFTEHPECQSVDITFQPRKTFPPMPCYGNPKTLELLMQDIENFYAKGEKRSWNAGGLPTENDILFSPPDWSVSCYCQYCQRLMEYSAPYNRQASRLMGNFLGRFSDAVAGKFPDKTIYFLAYDNFVVPASDRKYDNVKTQVALMWGDSLYHDPIISGIYDQWIRQWKEKTGRKVHLYQYLNWPDVEAPLPIQTLSSLKDFFVKHRGNVDGFSLDAISFGYENGNWGFQTPRLYSYFRLGWNPNYNVEVGFEEMVKLMYGPAAEPMRTLYALVEDRWNKVDSKKFPSALVFAEHQSGVISKREVYTKILSGTDIAEMKKLLAEAEKLVAGNEPCRRRLEFTGAPFKLLFMDYDLYRGRIKFENPVMEIKKVATMPEIDGTLDDSCWRSAAKNEFRPAYLSASARVKYPTSAQAVWTDKGIIFGFMMKEPDLEFAVIDQDRPYLGNSIEIFVQAKPNSVLQIVIDSKGNQVSFLYGEERKIENAQFKVKGIEGGWSAEIFVSFDNLNVVPVKSGETWEGNFARNRKLGKNDATYVENQRWNTRYAHAHIDKNSFGIFKFIE